MPRALRHPPAQNTLALTLPALLAWAAVSLGLGAHLFFSMLNA